MIEASLPAIDEILRMAAPAPRPQALAHDGEALWIGSWETGHVYGVDPKTGHVFEDVASPGKPVGCTSVGDELRFVVSENGDADNRFVRRFVPGHGFKSRDAFACPDDTGSFLAYDGSRLWLSQRHNKRVLEVDAQIRPLRTIDVGEEMLGMTWVGERLYFTLWFGAKRGGAHIGYIEPYANAPELRVIAQVPFVAVALAYDGDRLWTNDHRNDAIVALRVPGSH